MVSIDKIIKKFRKNLETYENIRLNPKIKNDAQFTIWERIVMSKLQESDIKFRKKSKKFPLEIDNKIIHYIPDFILDFSYKNRNRVIVEVHEKLTNFDVQKYRIFLDVYGRVYWFIVIVRDDELRKWNQFDHQEQALFHDIWTLENIDDLIFQLEQLRNDSKKKEKNEFTQCPKCEKKAEGRFEIDALFGYRYEGKKPQSYCRVCRTSNDKEKIKEEKFGNPTNVICPSCGKKFLEDVRGQSFCKKCLKRFYEK